MNAQPSTEGTRFVARTYVMAPYGEVWRRFSDLDAYAAWFSAPALEFGSEPGQRVAFGTEEGVLFHGVLTRFEPGHGLGFTFQFTFLESDEQSQVDIEVVEDGEVTRIVVVHDCTSAPETASVITEFGWVKDLARLKTLLETGTPMPWPEG